MPCENKVCKFCDGLDNTKRLENLAVPSEKIKKEDFSLGKCC